MYWNIHQILPFQRHFNFINGPRNIGKTYTCLKFLITQALFKQREFVYICRTQDELKNNVLKKAFSKVLQEQFSGIEYEFDKDKLYICNDDVKTVAGHAIALSAAIKIKRESYPNVHWLIFDEYMLESKFSSMYVNGWYEPDALLTIYETIDRGEERLTCFLMGNNTEFYNPYHMHPAFQIPYIEEGQIWTSKNVLFQRALPSEELKNKLASTAFKQMIKGTRYDNAMSQGIYQDSNQYHTGNITASHRYFCTLNFDYEQYGCYLSHSNYNIIVSNKVDLKFPIRIALDSENVNASNMFYKALDSHHFKTLKKLYQTGLLLYETPIIEKKLCSKFYRIFS